MSLTENQIRYRINAKRSRALSADMEKLIEDADVYEKLSHFESMEQNYYKIDSIKKQLDAIWDEQVELFFIVIEESQDKKRRQMAGLLLSPFRLMKNKNNHEVYEKTY